MNKIDKVILLAEKLGVKEEWLHDKTIQFLQNTLFEDFHSTL